MKKIYFVILISLLFITACNTNNSDNNSNAEKKSKEKKISKRDYSITDENAYNNLFLDSANLENFIQKKNVPDSLARYMRSFYNTRNYEFAWFSTNGLTEQAYGFWSLKNYEGDTSKSLKALQGRMDDLMSNDSLVVKSSDPSFINTELTLTENFISFTRSNYEKGYVKRKEMERFIPFKKQDPIYLSDSLLNKKHKDEKYFSDVNQSYKNLSIQLKKYTDIQKAGGLPAIPASITKIKKGHSSPDVIALKKYLNATGDLAQADTSASYDDTLVDAVKNFQLRFGLTPNGIISSAVLKEMNVPAIERVKQILINMNRMRWMPQEPDGELLIANIPEFMLHVYDGKNNVFNMKVVVGKDGHNTTIFSDRLSTIVFSPYWNVPESIVKKEIVPSMNEDKDYLEKNNMEITGQRDGLPVVRQKPGDKNSLGKVKFLFPNSFNIYFHDTPAKSLFNSNVRAFSHGCIRLSEPEKLADYLLRDDPKWTPEKINEAMNSGDEKFVSLKTPAPVFITYYTTWVDENGRLNFRNDIYGHDKEIAEKMFTN
ncbi:L,D-transpeptidase family protein [Ginsengibacter hankyongi]|uniref:L,D-transpeptidase family protein n=1 Tax=Ginsengibacter hankyongi TaxID=2607284 RepID=A0A5J5IFU3_9BACT|nr:L,D-transpeptidase family protein [Ginsengibacter hankyongi]KAA9038649.1 L,D-transpeptidase family protein [Ginsengibacter hankyongi]